MAAVHICNAKKNQEKRRQVSAWEARYRTEPLALRTTNSDTLASFLLESRILVLPAQAQAQVGWPHCATPAATTCSHRLLAFCSFGLPNDCGPAKVLQGSPLFPAMASNQHATTKQCDVPFFTHAAARKTYPVPFPLPFPLLTGKGGKKLQWHFGAVVASASSRYSTNYVV